MSAFHLRRCVVAIAMIAGLTTVGFGRSGPTGQSGAADGTASAVTANTSGWYGIGAGLPAQSRINGLPRSERGLRSKPLLAATAGTALGAPARVRRIGLSTPLRAPLPIALRGRSLPRRAPPPSPLG